MNLAELRKERHYIAARRADERAAMATNGDSATTAPEVAETPAE